MRLGRIFGMAIIVVLSICAECHPQEPLTIGSPAPELRYSAWLKGTPVKSLEKGKIYVIEFWATWCQPCRESMPHISKLAREFKGKVEFIGVDVWEKDGVNINTKASEFVEKMGNEMEYGAATDTPDKYMAVKWLEAAARNGIPAAFIIDKELNIAWIGHPVSIDEPLNKIIAGTYDGKEYAARLLKEQKLAAETIAMTKIFDKKGDAVKEAEKNKDYKKVVEECDKLAAAEPGLKYVIDGYYIKAYTRINPDKAIEIAENANIKWEEGFLYNYLFPFILKGLDNKCYNYAINYCRKSLAGNPGNTIVLLMLSMAYENKGEKDKAIDALEKLISAARKQKMSEEDLKPTIKRLNTMKGSA